MRGGCLAALALYGGLVALYRHFGSPYWDPPATWLAPLVAGLITLLGLGALWTARDRFREWTLLSRHRFGLPPRDGGRAVAVGTIEPLGEPLRTPFSDEPCVLYEYEIRRRRDDETKGAKDVAVAGFRMEPCVIRDGSRQTLMLGFPDLQEWPERFAQGLSAYARARRFLAHTDFIDISGLNVARALSEVVDVMADDDGSVSKDLRRAADPDSWLSTPELNRLLANYPGSAAPDALGQGPGEHDERDDEDLDDDDDEEARETRRDPLRAYNLPLLVEKAICPGETVCVFGVYSQAADGLIPSLRRQTIPLRLVRGTPETVAAKLRSSWRANLIGGLLTLVVVHLALWLGTLAYLNSTDTQRYRQNELQAAIAAGDLAEVERLLARGARPNRQTADGSFLNSLANVEMAALLLRYGADPDQTNQYGVTPLMEAARHGRLEMIDALLAAGAKIDFRNPHSGLTALMVAYNAEQDEAVARLLAAGAVDDTVGPHNGELVVDENAPQLATCREYLDAIQAADVDTLIRLSSAERPVSFDSVDWDEWRRVRPVDEITIICHANEQYATLFVQGRTPAGFTARWSMQLVWEGGHWKVLREAWLTGKRPDPLRDR